MKFSTQLTRQDLVLMVFVRQKAKDLFEKILINLSG